MARPKGSKNKPKEQEAVEFDYEQMDDTAYSSIMSTPHKNPAETGTIVVNIPPPAAENIVYATPAIPVQSMSFGEVKMKTDSNLELFSIEGRVRLDQIGAEEPIFSDQKRLVWASSFDEAVAKFSNYFKGLSTYNQRYSVVHAGGTEAIR